MEGADSRLGLLQDTPLFGGASGDTVRLVLERATRVTVKPGDYFFREGERGMALYWLERGRVAILKDRNGTLVELRQLAEGDCFGEIALFDFGPRSASVRAVESCCALELRPSLLREIRERDLEQYALLTLNMGRELSRRLRSAERRLFQLREEAAEDCPPST